MQKLILLLSLFFFMSCKTESAKKEIFEEQIKKDLENDAFKLNSTFNILELKVIRFESARLDSVYRELYYERLNRIAKNITDPDQRIIAWDNDKEVKNYLILKRNADTSIRGFFVKYYVKGTFINPNKKQQNLLYDTIVAYFDDKKLLLNKLYFDDWDFVHE